MGPSKGDKSIWFKDRLDITRYLRKGTNILAIIVLRYPENPMDGNHGMFRTATPGLYVKGKITTVDAQEISLDADDSIYVPQRPPFYRYHGSIKIRSFTEKMAGIHRRKNST